jgi:hypothetical protein
MGGRTTPDSAGEAAADGGLSWSLKQSFKDYVQALPDGLEELHAGASVAGNGTYTFPQAAVRASADQGRVFRFAGKLAFSGYAGLLHVLVAEPWVEEAAGTWILSVVDPDSRTSPPARIPLAQLPELYLSADDGQIRGSCTAPALTFEGTYLFGGVYPPGSLMDPLEFAV